MIDRSNVLQDLMRKLVLATAGKRVWPLPGNLFWPLPGNENWFWPSPGKENSKHVVAMDHVAQDADTGSDHSRVTKLDDLRTYPDVLIVCSKKIWEIPNMLQKFMGSCRPLGALRNKRHILYDLFVFFNCSSYENVSEDRTCALLLHARPTSMIGG